MTDRVKAVLFDIDGTLCQYERTTAELLQLAFEAAGVEPFFDRDEYMGRYGEFVHESDGVADLREQCFAAIAADSGRDPEVGRSVARAYASKRDHSRVRPREGLYDVLDWLGGRYRLAAVTNGAPEMQRTKLETLDLTDHFETVVHGGYDTPAKPATEAFEQALGAVDVGADRALYVGDTLNADIVGANRAGLYSVWIAEDGECADGDSEEQAPDARIRSLSELVDYLA